MKKKADEQRGKRTPTYVVGIGASAGGLEALRALFAALKIAPRNMAFVVVQHLAPLHRSRLVELIASTTRLDVEEVRDGMKPRRGVIHITPPNANLVVVDGRLRLKGTGVGPKPSVDTFFRSLATDCGPRAVGIVLSGSGSDGAAGIKAIREAGGVTIAQRPESAKYDSMPKAAIHTGVVDSIVAPEEIGRELMRVAAHRPGKRPRRSHAHADAYENIMRILERQIGVDFFKYKQSTIRRRLDRRLIATGCTTLEEYARYLERTQGEAQNLLQNILISVTSFFRDAEAFKALAQHVQEKVRAKRDGQHFRCWVVGCATGEEAYSLAILLSEAIERAKTNVRLHIFATDLDEPALAFARRATYPAASLVGLPAKLIDKYFQPLEDGSYQVRTSLRDTVVFAKHNATEDPPFLSVDLISCRNVLIYFNIKLQEKLFQTFEYALGKGGLLFLGKSEAVPYGNGAFRMIGRRQKIFERLTTRGDGPHPGRRETIRENAFLNRAKELGQALDLFNSVVAGLAPDSIVIDGQLYIKHVYGAAGELLMHPPGQATQNIAKLLPAEMGGEILALVHKAEKIGRGATGRRHEFKLKNQPRAVQTTVVPLASATSRDFLVCFHSFDVEAEAPRVRKAGAPAEERATLLQAELAEVREHLQTVIEEQETANEEAQSLNEELQSSNEELQSANEELETTNEELQSSNEELTTVNEELNVKTAELQSMNQRLHAVQNAIGYPLLIFDRARRLLNFNPAARQLFLLTDADLGAEMREAGALAEVEPLMRRVDDALARRKTAPLQLSLGGRSFEVQIQLFRNVKQMVDGGVMSLVDNTDIVRTLEENRETRERLSNILEATPAIVTMKDLGGGYLYANKRFSDMLRAKPESIIGHTDEELFGREVAAALREHDLEVVKRKKALEVTERYGLGGTGRTWSSSKFPLFDAKRRVQSVCTVSLDMTERIAYEQELELFKRAFSASNHGVLILEPAGTSGRDLRVAFASDQVAALADTTSAKLTGLRLHEVLESLRLPAQAPGGAHVATAIREGAQLPLVVPSERGGWLEVRSSRFDPTRGGLVVVTFLDVTQRVRDQRTIEEQQDELARITRFSALSEIAAGIAHEVNTPLSVIVAKADILRAKAGAAAVESCDANAIALDINKMAKNVSDIVHGLAQVASSKSNRLEKADLRRIVADAAKLCEPRAHRINAEVTLDLPEAEVTVECYPVQILQIMINLINNAIDAVAERRDRWVRVKLRGTAQEAQVAVTDSGPGISSGLAEKIFTPFFSTKKDREGTGIGLSLSRSIARRHHGEITLDMHAPNTSFRVALPRKQPDRRVIVLDARTEPSVAYTKPNAATLHEARPGRR